MDDNMVAKLVLCQLVLPSSAELVAEGVSAGRVSIFPSKILQASRWGVASVGAVTAQGDGDGWEGGWEGEGER
jgi:hypothetical protein